MRFEERRRAARGSGGREKWRHIHTFEKQEIERYQIIFELLSYAVQGCKLAIAPRPQAIMLCMRSALCTQGSIARSCKNRSP